MPSEMEPLGGTPLCRSAGIAHARETWARGTPGPGNCTYNISARRKNLWRGSYQPHKGTQLWIYFNLPLSAYNSYLPAEIIHQNVARTAKFRTLRKTLQTIVSV
jgi:hypothetical protein